MYSSNNKKLHADYNQEQDHSNSDSNGCESLDPEFKNGFKNQIQGRTCRNWINSIKGNGNNNNDCNSNGNGCNQRDDSFSFQKQKESLTSGGYKKSKHHNQGSSSTAVTSVAGWSWSGASVSNSSTFTGFTGSGSRSGSIYVSKLSESGDRVRMIPSNNHNVGRVIKNGNNHKGKSKQIDKYNYNPKTPSKYDTSTTLLAAPNDMSVWTRLRDIFEGNTNANANAIANTSTSSGGIFCDCIEVPGSPDTPEWNPHVHPYSRNGYGEVIVQHRYTSFKDVQESSVATRDAALREHKYKYAYEHEYEHEYESYDHKDQHGHANTNVNVKTIKRTNSMGVHNCQYTSGNGYNGYEGRGNGYEHGYEHGYNGYEDQGQVNEVGHGFSLVSLGELPGQLTAPSDDNEQESESRRRLFSSLSSDKSYATEKFSSPSSGESYATENVSSDSNSIPCAESPMVSLSYVILLL